LNFLDQQQSSFANLGAKINGRMDEMGKRMDDLERHISELMNEAGLEPSSERSPSNSQQAMTKTSTLIEI
jgi:hypothetical protein